MVMKQKNNDKSEKYHTPVNFHQENRIHHGFNKFESRKNIKICSCEITYMCLWQTGILMLNTFPFPIHDDDLQFLHY